MKVILTGDVNLMNVTDPRQPFARVREELRAADLVFSNLECSLYVPQFEHSIENEGFFADPNVGAQALQDAGIAAVGIANNVNYGEAPIRSSLKTLDEYGIAHTGAGTNSARARAPAIVERDGVRFGFLQRSSVYWSVNHEAGENGTGIAVLPGHTAYQVPMYKTRRGAIPFNRPGIPPNIVTWADPDYLDRYAQEVTALRKEVDIVVASCHWGLSAEVLTYMKEIAHRAIDAGADIVIGHGPHRPLPAGTYKGKPVFYGLGSFSFHTGHDGIKHGDWIGLMVDLVVDRRGISKTAFRFVRHNEDNETVPAAMENEGATIELLSKHSLPLGAKLEVNDNEIILVPGS